MGDERKPLRPATRLIHTAGHAPTDFNGLATPVWRGSTAVFASMAEVDRPTPGQYRYGLYGTPTARELAQRIATIEGANDCFLAPSGLAAIALTFLGLCRSGGHVLIPDSVYGPTRELALGTLADLGIATTFYDPMIGGEIADLIADNSQLVWTESPGSITMEVQDIAAIAAAAHARGVPVAIDNTYGAGVLFDAFAAGADISVQALTKYQGGHSDLLMGSVAVRDAALAARLRRTQARLGMSVSPDDCSLVLRGLKTFDVRLRHLEQSALAVARWLADRAEVTQLLHPAFPDCGGHDLWRRDWRGSASIFSIVLGGWTRAQVVAFVEALSLFKIGYSWGGANSLVMTYANLQRPTPATGPLLVRLNIGLEDPLDLIDDLEQAFVVAARA